MFCIRLVFLIPLAAMCAASSPASAQDPKSPPRNDKEEVLTKPLDDRRDQTLLRRVSGRMLVHEAARVSYTIPDGWKEIPPQRLARSIDPQISTVLGVENPERELIATLFWIPMNPGRNLSYWVRDTAIKDEFGEEYETLKAIYGAARVSAPVRFKHGPFDIYRINIRGGPDGGKQQDGTLFIFEVESGGTTHWLLKARVTYPKPDWGRNDDYAMEMLDGYRRLSEKVVSESRKSPEGKPLTSGSVDLDKPHRDKR